MSKKRALIVCPGRGTYNKEELGYLSRRHPNEQTKWEFIDEHRRLVGSPTVTELDGMERYEIKLHTLGEHASPLIYACSLADYLSLDQNEIEVVGITGNSMGWYTALSLSGVLEDREAIKLIDTMGSMMKGGILGGQTLYPYVDQHWKAIAGKRKEILETVAAISQRDENALYLSIDLGGYLVIAGNSNGLKEFEIAVPRVEERFPMRLYNHAAFHTPMLRSVSDLAFEQLGQIEFSRPTVPLIDGQGQIWTPYSADVGALKAYTFGHQVYRPYNFSKAIEVSVKEYAPDHIIVLGPGSTLGSSVAQTLIKFTGYGLTSKQNFKDRQVVDPVVISMGM